MAFLLLGLRMSPFCPLTLPIASCIKHRLQKFGLKIRLIKGNSRLPFTPFTFKFPHKC
nr:MAG TPA: hypothetical protein [Caudoviricetes sp.]